MSGWRSAFRESSSLTDTSDQSAGASPFKPRIQWAQRREHPREERQSVPEDRTLLLRGHRSTHSSVEMNLRVTSVAGFMYTLLVFFDCWWALFGNRAAENKRLLVLIVGGLYSVC
jgi:hypothetical protein